MKWHNLLLLIKMSHHNLLSLELSGLIFLIFRNLSLEASESNLEKRELLLTDMLPGILKHLDPGPV